MANCKITLKILLLGESNVGKTSLLSKYIDNKFTEVHITTIGVDNKYKEIIYNNMKINLNIWDSSGQEIYRSITKSFYRNADGIIFVYDVTNAKSFANLKDWLISTEEYQCKKIVVGNKIDLGDKRVIKKERIEQFAKEKNIQCFETSAKNGENIENIFKEITRLIVGNKTEEELKEEFGSNSHSSSILSKETFKSENEKKKCC